MVIMTKIETTCWTLILGAAQGNAKDRANFARWYGPLARDYLGHRWRSSRHRQDLEDAVQEFFLECFKQGGVLQRVNAESAGGFRAFLFGVLRKVALRVETRGARMREWQPASGVLSARADTEASLSLAFDRAWANSVLRETARRMAEAAQDLGEAAQRRVELLRLRFQEGLPIREIARRWEADAAVLHHEYARARDEFKMALLEVVALHYPGASADLEKACQSLLAVVG